jgi:hypothetical protein
MGRPILEILPFIIKQIFVGSGVKKSNKKRKGIPVYSNPNPK